MIISASRRTDIPCYYSAWFMNRLRAGFVLTRNPVNRAKISRIALSPDTVDCIVFWTKDAFNILPYLSDIDAMGYRYYFQFTLTPYDDAIERNLRQKEAIQRTFIALSRRIGKARVLWRYDPIILNNSLTIGYHKEQFVRLCEKLHPYTESVTLSFVDRYRKLKTDLIRELTADEIDELGAFMGQTAADYGLTAKACCEEAGLSAFGIESGRCIDQALIEKICRCRLDLPADKNQRPNCHCGQSIDIGAYNTCLNGCIYCYANNGAAHYFDAPESALLGALTGYEKITERKVKSNKI